MINKLTPELQKIIQDKINASTWDLGRPKYYMDKDGWLVEHWENGIIKKLEKLTTKPID